ncbi:Ser/Thr protein phosphatase family protein [Clostridium bornimense]|uniref:Ser/Thr protein phosphatase family protein n=1 Tax=Clostridium bornimense TaxID=1216932 RepID=W6RXF6_9CLOT|nr:DNA repair exonuclease [Clostridium bornimense]CDM69346.1 Ser/Thr protein phosphatase family protein [Clostridium bornimense]
MIKVLQLGDVHFDTPFKGLGTEISSIRKEDIRETFKKAILRGKEEKVDFILITGDLFDNKRVFKETLVYIANVLKSVSPIKVFISPGNHDPYNEDSFYKLMEWPENVHIFKSKMETVEIADRNVVIHGVAFNEEHVEECLLHNVKGEDGKINIAVIHGDVISGGESLYNPITEEDIKESNMTYIAIGHKHKYSGLLKSGETYYGYSGALEGRSFNETGEKGVLILEIEDEVVKEEFLSLSKRKHIDIDIDITDKSTTEEICEKICSSIGENSNDMIRVNLIGEIEDIVVRENVIKEKLKDKFFYIEINDNTKEKIDYENIKKEKSLRGIFISEMLKCDDEESTEALKYGLMALEGEDII